MMASSEDLQRLARAQPPFWRRAMVLGLSWLGLLLVSIGLLVAANFWPENDWQLDAIGGFSMLALLVGGPILLIVGILTVKLYQAQGPAGLALGVGILVLATGMELPPPWTWLAIAGLVLVVVGAIYLFVINWRHYKPW